MAAVAPPPPKFPLPHRVWIKDRRQFNRVLRFANATGTVRALRGVILRQLRDGLEIEIYPFHYFGIEVVIYQQVTDDPSPSVMAVSSVTVQFDPSSIGSDAPPWRME
jgi:hypothetical protein